MDALDLRFLLWLPGDELPNLAGMINPIAIPVTFSPDSHEAGRRNVNNTSSGDENV